MKEDRWKPLRDFRAVTLALNVPGPVAASRLAELGAEVLKIEPPAGDPLAQGCPEWYRALTVGQTIIQLDLKSPETRHRLDGYLQPCDLLLTSSRPQALERLALDWPTLHRQFPELCQVAILGYKGERANTPGHDLLFQARAGLVAPPALPRTLIADLAGAERAVSVALALLLARERGAAGGYAEVALADAAIAYAAPLALGLTAVGGPLGGHLSSYNLYPTKRGWIALAALEPHFWQRLEKTLALDNPGHEVLKQRFLTRTADEWASWAAAIDLPIAALQDTPAFGGEA